MRLSIGRRVGPWWLGVSFRPSRPAAKYWTHGTCTIHHRTPEAANRCRGTR